MPTVCSLGVLVSPDLTAAAGGGYLLQLLPGADDETIDKLEGNMPNVPAVSTMVHQGLSNREILDKALAGFEYEVIEERDVFYRCDCSHERVEKVLISLGYDELIRLSKEQEETTVECHFCEKKYNFSAKEIADIAEKSR